MKKILTLFLLSLALSASGCSDMKIKSSDAPEPVQVEAPAASPSIDESSGEVPVASPNVDESSEEEDSPTSEKEQQHIETPVVPYDGIVEHIFFHPLIAYPELAFDDDYQSQGYNDYFTTVPEFERIIEELHNRNFILVHLSDVYEEKNENGKIEIASKTLMLPEGKKPLVISIDDLNYYQYMIDNGNAYKLILDEQGNVATYSKNPQGEDVISYDNEIVPILDQFVEEHPDFSLNGAKGTIAITGFEGVLGYRTQADHPNRATEIDEAKKVIQQLKETGWIFASHSYGHINVANASLSKLKEDTEKWKAEVESLVGETPLYIYPYGARPDYDSDKFEYLVSSGYKVLSAVGPTSYKKITNGAYTMDRRHMDGIAFIKQSKTLDDLFDADIIVDKEARPAKYFQ